MTEIRFYHLTVTPLEKALPQILRKVMEGEKRAVIQFNDMNLLRKIDDMLWVFSQRQPIPHGTKQDGYEADQPLYLTTEEENPNKAESLINIGKNGFSEFAHKFSQYIDIIDGNDASELEEARKRYEAHKNSGKNVTYFKQDANGAWIKG
jgi:DNA polymerase III subunit chi